MLQGQGIEFVPISRLEELRAYAGATGILGAVLRFQLMLPFCDLAHMGVRRVLLDSGA